MKARAALLLGLLAILAASTFGIGSIFHSVTVAQAAGTFNVDGSSCSQGVLNHIGTPGYEISYSVDYLLRANIEGSSTYYYSSIVTFTGQDPFVLTVPLPGNIPSGSTIVLELHFGGNPDAQVVYSASYTCSVSSSSGGRPPSFTDGRVNNEQQWQTAAIWCDDSDVLVYRVIDSVGQFAFRASAAEIAAAEKATTKPALVKQALGVSLYVDPDGGLTVMAPNLDPNKSDPYIFSWSGCPL